MPPVIELHGLGKRYWKLEENVRLARAVLPFSRPRRSELWALREVDLSVAAGETVGVLGHNGAGKTTLLRLLAGVTSPSEGRVRVVGRIAPLISLGVGFDREMSGRENVMVNGMLLGLTARQVAERFDSIVDFAELSDFIDTPVKFYSSGMFMRLGFAVVVHVDPTILLVDEILAVGDAAFQVKCFERLSSLRDRGAAIVMVSHSLHTIRQVCQRALLIRHGRIVHDGDVERAIAAHFHAASSAAGSRRGSDAAVEVVQRTLTGDIGDGHHARYDEAMRLALKLRFHRPVQRLQVSFSIETDLGYPVMMDDQTLASADGGFAAESETDLAICFRARLGGGNYRLAVALHDDAGGLLGACDALMLFVAGGTSSMGVIEHCAEFSVDGVDRTDRRSRLLGAREQEPRGSTYPSANR